MGGKMPLFEVLNENNQHFLEHVWKKKLGAIWSD
jgi:hypothetical protein